MVCKIYSVRARRLIPSITGTNPPTLHFTGQSDGQSSVESSCTSPSLALENKDEVSWFCYPQRNSTIPSHNNESSQIPLIRVASKSLRLELMAVTNWPVKTNFIMGLSERQGSSESCAPPPPDSDNPLKSSLTDPVITVPTFTIPTSHTHRKAKMDRIRKRLGSEVPYDVVFPEDVEPGKSLGRKWPNSERLTPQRKDTMKPVSTFPPAYSSNPTHRHPERRRTDVTTTQRLSFIPEYPDESPGVYQDSSRMKDGTSKRRNTANSRHLSTRSESCEDGQGVVTFKKHSSSYRKPPPSMLDDSICSF